LQLNGSLSVYTSVFEKESNDGLMPLRKCELQCAPIFPNAGVDIGPMLDEQPDNRLMPVPSRCPQSTTILPSLSIYESAALIPHVFKEKLDRVGVPERCSLLKRCARAILPEDVARYDVQTKGKRN
jgi:hypothetical protein